MWYPCIVQYVRHMLKIFTSATNECLYICNCVISPHLRFTRDKETMRMAGSVFLPNAACGTVVWWSVNISTISGAACNCTLCSHTTFVSRYGQSTTQSCQSIGFKYSFSNAVIFFPINISQGLKFIIIKIITFLTCFYLHVPLTQFFSNRRVSKNILRFYWKSKYFFINHQI